MDKIQYACRDSPTSKDYTREELEKIKSMDSEYAEGIHSKRPKEKITLWNQGNTPACTCYSGMHVSNGLNIIEDSRLGTDRPQINPSVLWDKFCKARNNYLTGTSIQTMANFLKKEGLIEGYVTISNSAEDLVGKMRKALDTGYFLSTGSANGDRTAIRKTGIYTVRADSKYVGHGRCIVDYEDDYFWAVNSWGDTRGPYNGYFQVPNELVDKIYNKLCYIDKNDGLYFERLALYKKVQELEQQAKDVYGLSNQHQKDYRNGIQLTKNLETLYKM